MDKLTWVPTPCRQCGRTDQPGCEWPQEWDGRPWCEACHAQAQAARVAEALRIQRLVAAQFADLPAEVARALVRAGIETRGHASALTDAELLALPRIGPVHLADVRSVFPGPPAPARHVCPTCQGTGTVDGQDG